MSEYLTVSGRTHTGLVRENNEDALILADLSRASSIRDNFAWHRSQIGENGLLLAIADGMGGANGGGDASDMTVNLLYDYLQRLDRIDSAGLHDAIVFTNETVFAKAEANAELKGMGATLTAMVVNNGTALIAHIGDTRAYLLRGDDIIRLTKDHSLVQSLVDAGVMTAADAETSNKRNILLSAIGHSGKLEPDLATIDLEPEDQLLICSDGRSGPVRDFEVKNVLKLMLTTEEKCERFIQIANERGGSDNVTVIVVRYHRDNFVEVTEEMPSTKRFPNELF